MRKSDYELLDSGNFKKLERYGDVIYCRPSLAAVWPPQRPNLWGRFDGEFVRYENGKGEWKIKENSCPTSIKIEFPLFKMKTERTSFGHVGIFPEQRENWKRLYNHINNLCEKNEDDVEVLNLFAYTGGSSLASRLAGAKVTHVDASKTSINWAKENALGNGIQEGVRWIHDDVMDFVQREVRRKKRYHGVILDPPSYGRGTQKQVWKIENHLTELLTHIQKILDAKRSFVLLSAHSSGYSPLAQENLLKHFFSPQHTKFVSGEMVIFPQEGKGLPSGAFAFSHS